MEPHLLALLPTASRSKIERLLIERDAARAAYRDASDRERAAWTDAGRAESELNARLDGYRARGLLLGGLDLSKVALRDPGAMGADEPTLMPWSAEERDRIIAQYQSTIDAVRSRHRLAVEARDIAIARWENFAFLENVETWLQAAAGGGAKFERAAVAPIRARDGAAEVAKQRAALVGVASEWSATENAPAPAHDLKARAFAEIAALAEKGAPAVHARSRDGSPINLRRVFELGVGAGRSGPILSGDGGAAFWVWMFRGEIEARIGALIDALPQAGALTDEKREREFARIAAKRLEIERIEEAVIVAAEHDGRVIPRRRDADARAILEVVEA